jgi:hypothetical protein
MSIYVSHFASDTTEAELRALFEPFGAATRATIYPLGFAIVRMPDSAEGERAISGLSGGRLIVAACKAR